MKYAPQNQGFTLLEVMVALVIFSIGLIGLAGLQAVSLQNNQVAYSRTIATQLAYDLADRIRANKTTANTTVNPPVPSVISANYATANIQSTQPNPACRSGSSCTPDQLAIVDLYEWNQAIIASQASLLNAKGFVNRIGTTFTITIAWDEGRSGNSPAAAADCDTPPAWIGCVRLDVQPL